MFGIASFDGDVARAGDDGRGVVVESDREQLRSPADWIIPESNARRIAGDCIRRDSVCALEFSAAIRGVPEGNDRITEHITDIREFEAKVP